MSNSEMRSPSCSRLRAGIQEYTSWYTSWWSPPPPFPSSLQYDVYVPLECDFRREAACMQATGQALAHFAEKGMPLLSKVM
jgi:hypothetical protein